MEIVGVDPRDQRWACDRPRYRVYFYEGTASDEYEVRGADDVHSVIKWAEDDSAGRPYVLYACVDQDGLGPLRLAGRDPNDDPDPSAAVTSVPVDSDSEDGRSTRPWWPGSRTRRRERAGGVVSEAPGPAWPAPVQGAAAG